VRAKCRSLVRTVSHQGLRTVPLLVRPLLIDLAGTTIVAAAVGGLFIWKAFVDRPSKAIEIARSFAMPPQL
jgi:hypothetical protein